VLLAVGDADFLATTAPADFDKDGQLEPYGAELTGLAGSGVSVLAAPDTSPAVVLTLNGLDYYQER
jgi:hypothetical protein